MPKPHPRRNRDGTISYRVRFRYRGKETSETFPTLARANTFCNDIKRVGLDAAMTQREADETTAELEATDNLDQVATDFFTWKEGRTRSPRSVQDYRRDYDETISPRLGARPVGTITARDVQTLVDDMRAGKIVSRRTKKPLGNKSICGRHALLHQILGWAADPQRGIIPVNPCLTTTLPKPAKTKPKGLMPAEWQAARSMLALVDGDATDMADFLIASGWRWSEAAALTVAAVEDYGPGQPMFVSMQQVARRTGKTGKTKIVTDGKAEASLRRIKLGTSAAAMIRRRCQRLDVTDYVLTHHGLPWTYNGFAKLLRRAGENANLTKTVTPHVLRHSHVGWMILRGAGLAEIKGRIGHASIKTTVDVYGGMIADVQDDVLEAFEQMRTLDATKPRELEDG